MASSTLIAQGVTRRRAIVRFIKAFVKKHGYPPSIREITEAVGLSSTAATRRHLDLLREEKVLDWTEGRYRSLRVL